MLSAGIVDPAEVVRIALQDAASASVEPGAVATRSRSHHTPMPADA
jgi:hypothetical protein